eukprot:NODE_334_length_10694_cov_0.301180.p3 type:complete len:393 gc:universal NODE_334_length_10694_cov_0.301180:6814-5636(-)
MNHFIPAVMMYIHVILEFIRGLYTHKYSNDLQVSKMNRFAFGVSRGIRKSLDHKLFTVHRFRLCNAFTDSLALLYVSYKMKVQSVLHLGRPDEEMYYSIDNSNGVVSYKYTFSKTNIRSPRWNIPVPYNASQFDEDFRIRHLGPRPKVFKSTFLVPKKRPCSKWILYVPGGAFIYHNALLLPRIQSIFPDYGIAFVEYSIVPEKSWPSPIIDVLDTYKYLIDVLDVNPREIAFLSDSAGGNISLCVMQQLKLLSLELPSCAVFISPWTDLTCSGDSFKLSHGYDYLDNKLDISKLLGCYCNVMDVEAYMLNDKLFSPINGDLSNMPPILINTGEYEALLDDNKVFYDKLTEHGNLNTIHTVYDKMPHIHQMMGLKESFESLAEIQKFVNKYI